MRTGAKLPIVIKIDEAQALAFLSLLTPRELDLLQAEATVGVKIKTGAQLGLTTNTAKSMNYKIHQKLLKCTNPVGENLQVLSILFYLRGQRAYLDKRQAEREGTNVR